MYNRGRQNRHAGPIGIGSLIDNVQLPGPKGIIQAVPMKEVYMFAGIDGTGDYNDKVYERDFATSFVNDFTKQIRGNTSKGKYIRGPGNWGFSTDNKARELYNIVKELFLSYYEDGKYLKIMLAGYSRGGVAVCYVANLLNKDNIPVHGLFLFDPVGRTTTLSGNDTTIPKNVSYVYRTQRDSKSGSRESFGTDCTKYWNGSSVDTNKFITTHGGMGGCPWGSAGEAKYYNITNHSIKSGYSYTHGKYYKIQPTNGVLDNTKPTLILEGFPDSGPTALTLEQETRGYKLAEKHYKKNLVDIGNKKACLHKLKTYEVALAQKKNREEYLNEYRYKKNTGQLLGGFKM